MKNPPTLWVLAILVALLISTGKYLLADEIPCTTAPVEPETNGAAWPKGTASNPTTVTVILNPNDFPTNSERSAIADAFTTWQNATLGHILFLMSRQELNQLQDLSLIHTMSVGDRLRPVVVPILALQGRRQLREIKLRLL